MYYEIYNVLVETLYGAVELSTYQEQVAVLLATIGSIAVVALPFLMSYWIFQFIFSLGVGKL